METFNHEDFSQTEKIAFNRGYKVLKDGTFLNPEGNIIGCNSKINGYYVSGIKINGISKNLKIHRLQAYQKFGDKIFDSNLMIRHLNGIKTDNSWDNIILGTNQENQLDIPKQKRINRSINSNKKYSNEFILHIREEYKFGVKLIDLSRKYNIPKSSIHNLLNKNLI